MAGWQKIYRDIQYHWLWEDKPFSRGQAWIDLILLMNHEDGKTLIDGVLKEVKRGSKVTSLRKLSEQWGWSTTKVKKFLEQLEKDEMITYKSDSKKTFVIVENYDVYQGNDLTEVTEKKHRNNTEVIQKKNRSKTEINKQEIKEYIKNDKEGKEEKKVQLQPLSFPTEFHKRLFDYFHEITYRTIFEDCEIKENGDLIIITVKEEFKKATIQNRANELRLLFGKDVSVKAKESEGSDNID